MTTDQSQSQISTNKNVYKTSPMSNSKFKQSSNVRILKLKLRQIRAFIK